MTTWSVYLPQCFSCHQSISMCYRFALELWDPNEFQNQFDIGLNDEHPIESNFNTAITTNIPVIIQNEKTRLVTYMKWWLIPHRAKDASISNKLANARSESVFEKPSFSESIVQRRCIVPASWFFEWQDMGKRKQPFYISSASQSYLGLAGIYDLRNDPEKPWWSTITSVSLLTTEPNNLIEPLHDRMPVILDSESYNWWLSPDKTKEDLMKFFEPINSETLQMRQVSPAVNNVRYKGTDTIQKVSNLFE